MSPGRSAAQSEAEPAERAPEAPGPGTSKAPRFALRFERGRGIVSLARPLLFELGEIAELEIDIGRIAPGTDLREGPVRFRHRWGRVLRVEARVSLEALARELGTDELPRLVPVISSTPGSIGFARVGATVVAGEIMLAWRGRDLVGALREVRSVADAGGPAILEIVGDPRLRFDRRSGAVRIEDPLLGLLTAALVPHGWRAPQCGDLERQPPVLREGWLSLAAGRSAGPPASASERSALDDAAELAPAILAIEEGRRVSLESARSEEAAMLAAELDVLAGQPPRLSERARSTPRGVSILLRAAIRDGDGERAFVLADTMLDLEPSADLAIEAARRTAALMHADGATLLARARARRPHDLDLARDWLEALERAGEPVQAARTGDLRDAARRQRRGDVLVLLARRLADHASSIELWRDAVEVSPARVEVHAGLAGALAAAGRADEAIEEWDRAFELAIESPAEMSALALDAARSAIAAGRPTAALTRLDRGLELARDERTLLAIHIRRAELLRQRAPEHAASSEDVVLELADRNEHESIAPALTAAAEHALSRRETERARALIAALRRRGIEAGVLARQLEQLTRDR